MLASDACEALALDRVVFIPNAQQPLKGDTRQARPEERLEMTRLAAGGDVRFAVDAREIDRGGMSYTVDTLEGYAAGSPAEERFFLVGADVRATFSRWRAPRRIAELAHLAILCRGDAEAGKSAQGVVDEIRRVTGPGILDPVVVTTRRIDVSSTEIRARVRDGRSIHGFVTEAVERFVRLHALYR
jgi:nicotinate-nucleotide adenylyltransferase